MTPLVRIERARPEDLNAVLALLAQHHLPPDGLSGHLATLLAARRDDRIVGSAGLEIYDDGALLRSVAVAPELQGQGIGRRLTESAIAPGESLASRAIYLLTTTAGAHFAKLGFERIDRDAAPNGVRTSVEFTSACPASAVVMRRRLKQLRRNERLPGQRSFNAQYMPLSRK
jgi:amino-acid N-acetyltransferase